MWEEAVATCRQLKTQGDEALAAKEEAMSTASSASEHAKAEAEQRLKEVGDAHAAAVAEWRAKFEAEASVRSTVDAKASELEEQVRALGEEAAQLRSSTGTAQEELVVAQKRVVESEAAAKALTDAVSARDADEEKLRQALVETQAKKVEVRVSLVWW